MNTKVFYIINIIILLISITNQAELRWAFEIFRHGARTPYSGMTSDFKDCFNQQWIGLKELTGVGLRQHFLVGYRNRIKYINEAKLIKPYYDPREVYIISTDSNRTIMSANAQIQGLYPPGTGPSIYPNQTERAVPPVNTEDIQEEIEKLNEYNYTALPYKMNIIPVHSFFNADHFIQLQDKKVCPKTLEYYTKNQQRPEVVDFLNNMTEKYGDKLNEKLIIKDKSRDVLKDYTKAYYIFDTIIASYTEGYDLPDLGVSEQELLNDSYQFFIYDLVGNGIDRDKDICLYSMSPIFDRILKWIDLKIEKDIKGEKDYTNFDLPKFVMFSAHDSTCGAFMGFMLEVFRTEIAYPYFATNINLELYLDQKGATIKKEDYYIEYIINDESIKNISYTEFVDTLKKRMKTMDEVNKFCGFTKEEKDDGENDDDDSIYIWISVALGVLLIILIGLIIFTIKHKKEEFKNVENIDTLGPFNEENN